MVAQQLERFAVVFELVEGLGSERQSAQARLHRRQRSLREALEADASDARPNETNVNAL